MDALRLPDDGPRRAALLGLSLFFVAAGANHFRDPEFYLAIMPPYVPAAAVAVALSGLLEVLGGIAVLVPRLRAPAGWGLVVLLGAIFPANLHMALNPDLFPELPTLALYGRLPLQVAMGVWAIWATRDPGSSPSGARAALRCE